MKQWECQNSSDLCCVALRASFGSDCDTTWSSLAILCKIRTTPADHPVYFLYTLHCCALYSCFQYITDLKYLKEQFGPSLIRFDDSGENPSRSLTIEGRIMHFFEVSGDWSSTVRLMFSDLLSLNYWPKQRSKHSKGQVHLAEQWDRYNSFHSPQTLPLVCGI